MNAATARARFVNDGMATMTPAALLVALYDRLVRDLDVARAAIEASKISDAHEALVHAQEIIYELTLALRNGDGWEGSASLADLYEWVYRRLIEANARKDISLLDACASVMVPLRDAWAEASPAAKGVNDD